MAGLKEQTLSREQMVHLKKLGVDTTSASVVLIFQDEDGHEVDWYDVCHRKGEPVYVDEDDYEWELSENYLDAETGRYDQSYRDGCGVFTLPDIWALLPKTIICNGKKYRLKQNYRETIGFEISYSEEFGNAIYDVYSDSFLEVAYKTLCWVAKRGFLNKE